MTRIVFLVSALVIFSATLPAQFSVDSKSIDGRISWSETYYNGDNIGTVFIMSPSAAYFVKNDVALTASFSLTAFRFDREWLIDDATLGVGAKYYYEVQRGAIYVGSSLHFESPRIPKSLLSDAGFMYGLNKTVFIEVGLSYSMGLGDNKSSTVTLGVGLATFF